MPYEAYLTIDDSVSDETRLLTNYLAEHDIPAVLFCRGDLLDANPESAIYAAELGLTLANHAYSHSRASQIGYQAMVDEISRTEDALDTIYHRAGVRRGARYFRFPHMDRGCGGWIVDYDAHPAHREKLISLFADGLNITLDPPSDAQRTLKADLQSWLKNKGFSQMPFQGVTFPWYCETEMADAMDAMFTFSTSDWMVGPRHRGKWKLKDEADLIARIDADESLKEQGSRHIILAHDQPGLFASVRTLLEHFRAKGFRFIRL